MGLLWCPHTYILQDLTSMDFRKVDWSVTPSVIGHVLAAAIICPLIQGLVIELQNVYHMDTKAQLVKEEVAGKRGAHRLHPALFLKNSEGYSSTKECKVTALAIALSAPFCISSAACISYGIT